MNTTQVKDGLILAIVLGVGIVGFIAARKVLGIAANPVQSIVNAGSAVSSAVVTAANNPDVNPLQPAGQSLGQTIYDVFHPRAFASPAIATPPTAYDMYTEPTYDPLGNRTN